MSETTTATGFIVVVQEQRFRMTTTGGQSLLLTLANAANVGARDLERLRDAHSAVRVRYTGDPGLDSARAERVDAAPDVGAAG